MRGTSMQDNERRVWMTFIWALALTILGCTLFYEAKEAIWKSHWAPQMEQQYVFPKQP
jgi:hypothetical protein